MPAIPARSPVNGGLVLSNGYSADSHRGLAGDKRCQPRWNNRRILPVSWPR